MSPDEEAARLALARVVRGRNTGPGGDTTAYLLAVGVERLLTGDGFMTDDNRAQLARVAARVVQQGDRAGGDRAAPQLAEVANRLLARLS